MCEQWERFKKNGNQKAFVLGSETRNNYLKYEDKTWGSGQPHAGVVGCSAQHKPKLPIQHRFIDKVKRHLPSQYFLSVPVLPSS